MTPKQFRISETQDVIYLKLISVLENHDNIASDIKYNEKTQRKNKPNKTINASTSKWSELLTSFVGIVLTNKPSFLTKVIFSTSFVLISVTATSAFSIWSSWLNLRFKLSKLILKSAGSPGTNVPWTSTALFGFSIFTLP